MKASDLLTVNEAASIKGVTRQAIWAAIKAGKLATEEVSIPSVRIKRGVLAKLIINPNMQRSGRSNGKSKQ